jgi:hypothetical protein
MNNCVTFLLLGGILVLYAAYEMAWMIVAYQRMKDIEEKSHAADGDAP